MLDIENRAPPGGSGVALKRGATRAARARTGAAQAIGPLDERLAARHLPEDSCTSRGASSCSCISACAMPCRNAFSTSTAT
eukprot:357205-Pyramimonas_sp.AAC.1